MSEETLKVKVDTSDVQKGAASLDTLSAAGARAEVSTGKLTSATAMLNRAVAAVAGSYALLKTAQYIQEATLLNARYETLGIAMTVVGRNAGYTAAQMTAAADAMQKTGISMIESRQQALRLVQAHIDLSQASKLARIAQDAAVIGNINSSEAFSRLIHGIQSGQTEVLRTIGINVTMERSYEEMAKTLGVTTKQLSQAQRTQAVINSVMREGAAIAGAYEAAMGTAGKQLLSMERYTENLKLAIGETFNEALVIAVEGATSGIKGLNQEVTDLAVKGQLREWGRSAIMVAAVIVDGFLLVKNTFVEVGREIGFLAAASNAFFSGEFTNLARMIKLRSEDRAEFANGIGSMQKAAQARFALMDKDLAAIGTTTELTGRTKQHTESLEVNNVATKALTDARNKAIEGSQRFIENIKQETQEIGMNAVQKRMMSAAAEAAKAPTTALKEEIMASAQAWAVASDAQQRVIDVEKTQLQTMAEIAAADKLHLAAITDNARASVEAARSKQAEWGRIGNTIEQTGKMAFVQFAAHGVNAMKSIGQAIKLSIIDVLYQLTVRKWMITVGTSITGAMTAGAANAAGGSAMSSLFDAAGMMNAGKMLWSGFSGGLSSGMGTVASGIGNLIGSSALTSFGVGMAGTTATSAAAASGAMGLWGASGVSGMAGMGASMAAMAGPLAAVAGALIGLRALNGDKELFGLKGWGATLLLGGLPAMFGLGPKKVIGQGVEGEFGTGGFQGQDYVDTLRKGGWFRGNRQEQQRSDVSPAVVTSMSSAMSLLRSSTAEYANVLSLPTDAIAGYAKKIKVAFSGDEAKDKVAIEAMFLGIADELANLTGNFSKFIREGETAATTLQRLALEFVSVDNALKAMNLQFGAVGLESMEARERLIALSGGIDALNSAASFYQANFLNEGQRFVQQSVQVISAMEAIGHAEIKTKTQFAGLVDSLDLASEAGARMFAALMQIAPTFSAVADAVTKAQAENLAAAQSAADQTARAREDGIAAAQNGVMTATSNLVSAYNAEKSALDGLISKFKGFVATILLLNASLAIANPGNVEGIYREQVELARSGNEAAINGLGAVQNAYLDMKRASSSTALDYARSVASVMSVNSSLATAMSGEAGKTETQLSLLSVQVGALVTINDSVLSVRDAISALSIAKGAVAAAASPVQSADTQFVTGLYSSLLNRAPDAAGLAGWTAALASGASAASVMAGFTGSDEYKRNSHAGGLDYVPYDGYKATLHQGERVKTAKASGDEDQTSKEIRDMRTELNAALVAIAITNSEIAQKFKKWDGDGMPATRTV